MNTRADEIRRQVNGIWKQAVGQLEGLREAIIRRTDRFDADINRLRQERDRLLRRLGEQTHKLADQGTLPMPAFVRSTVDRLNDVLDKVVAGQPDGKKQRSTKAPATKKKPVRKARTDVN
jgi:hypothetical protein